MDAANNLEMTMILSYAYTPGTISLCRAHADAPPAHLPPLGSVQDSCDRGCVACEERKAARERVTRRVVPFAVLASYEACENAIKTAEREDCPRAVVELTILGDAMDRVPWNRHIRPAAPYLQRRARRSAEEMAARLGRPIEELESEYLAQLQ